MTKKYKLITENYFSEIENEIKKAKVSLLVVSPYIKRKVARKIINLTENKNLTCMLLTLKPGIEYLMGVSDYEALKLFEENYFEIRFLENLHAKIFVVDNKIAFIGSANLTNRGMGLLEENQNANNGDYNLRNNKEILIKIDEGKDTLSIIEKEYWENIYAMEHSSERINELGSQIEQIKNDNNFLRWSNQNNNWGNVLSSIFDIRQSPYKNLLIYLYENNKIRDYSQLNGYGRNAFMINGRNKVKIFRRSKNEVNESIAEEYYSFKITCVAGEDILKNDLYAIILILEEPGNFIWLPKTFVIKNILNDNKKRRDGSWSFQVIKKTNEFILQIKNSKGNKRQFKHNINEYANKVKLRVNR